MSAAAFKLGLLKKNACTLTTESIWENLIFCRPEHQRAEASQLLGKSKSQRLSQNILKDRLPKWDQYFGKKLCLPIYAVIRTLLFLD